MKISASLYKRHRFPPEIIQHAVWLYHYFNLNSRDIEDLLADRNRIRGVTQGPPAPDTKKPHRCGSS
jgi:transposase-like protein